MSVEGLPAGALGGRAARQFVLILSCDIVSNVRLVLVPALGQPFYRHVCWVIGRRCRMPCRTGLAPLAKKLELLLKRPDASPPFATQRLTRMRERSSAVLILG